MKELDGFENYAKHLIADVLSSVQIEFGRLYMRDGITHDELDLMYSRISQHKDQKLKMITVSYNCFGIHCHEKPTREAEDALDDNDNDESESRDGDERQSSSEDEGEDLSDHESSSNDEEDDEFDEEDDEVEDEDYDAEMNLLGLNLASGTDSSEMDVDAADVDFDYDDADGSALADEVEELLADSNAAAESLGAASEEAD